MADGGGAERYRLYWEAMSGAMAVELVLEEMGLAYERRAVDMAAGEHRTAEYLRLNPTGQVPALALPDGRVIGESAAIILTLGDRHPGTGLVPNAAAEARPVFLRWLIYMAASPYMTFVQFNHPERFVAAEAVHGALVENARARLRGQFDALEGAIEGDPFFQPGGPTALDFYAFMLLAFHPGRAEVLEGRPRLRAMAGALEERESVRRVMPGHLGAA